MDANTLLTNVGGRYGAPMGRIADHTNTSATVCLFRVRMVDDAYDSGGAYWGSGTPLYAAIGDDFAHYLRAENFAAAYTALNNLFSQLCILDSSQYESAQSATEHTTADLWKTLTTEQRAFVTSYLDCALWTCNEDDDTPYNESHGIDDFARSALMSAITDCLTFIADNRADLESRCLLSMATWQPGGAAYKTAEQAGHDFWLTRNGHGCGFWSRPEVWGEEQAARLTSASVAFGESDVYDADGLLYFSP